MVDCGPTWEHVHFWSFACFLSSNNQTEALPGAMSIADKLGRNNF